MRGDIIHRIPPGMSWWVVALRLMGLGWYVAACVVIGVLGGLGLDKLVGTRPVFTLLGTVLGSVIAFWGVYKLVLPVLYGGRGGGATGNGRKR
jgi:F0F1-type ATP synthase assembly protein I